MAVVHGPAGQRQEDLASGSAAPATTPLESVDTWDAMEAYFECITTCSLEDGECVTRCVEELREHA